MSINRRQLKKLPDAPGVYFFKRRGRRGRAAEILYIGRATSLCDRVKSYFDEGLPDGRGPFIALMMKEADSLDFRKTDSILEAILLEAELIRARQPRYNTKEKDDKSFNCIAITREEFPRVLVVRARDVDFSSLRIHSEGLRIRAVYGPFPYGLEFKQAVSLIRRIFPWRDSACVPCAERVTLSTPHIKHPHKRKDVRRCTPCFNRQIGLCPGVCTGEISARDYRAHIRQLALFLSGKKAAIVRELERDMKKAAREEKFEKAAERKRTLFSLKHIQDVSLLKRVPDYGPHTANVRIEAYDLSHFGGADIVGAMAVVENGEVNKSFYRLFTLRTLSGIHEAAGLQELLRRRFNHPEWPLPSLIVVDGNDVQKAAAEEVVCELGLSVPVAAVVKDERHRPKAIVGAAAGPLKSAVLLANSEAHRFALKFQRKRRSQFR